MDIAVVSSETNFFVTLNAYTRDFTIFRSTYAILPVVMSHCHRIPVALLLRNEINYHIRTVYKR
jgi:hypothetical protein